MRAKRAHRRGESGPRYSAHRVRRNLTSAVAPVMLAHASGRIELPRDHQDIGRVRPQRVHKIDAFRLPERRPLGPAPRVTPSEPCERRGTTMSSGRIPRAFDSPHSGPPNRRASPAGGRALLPAPPRANHSSTWDDNVIGENTACVRFPAQRSTESPRLTSRRRAGQSERHDAGRQCCRRQPLLRAQSVHRIDAYRPQCRQETRQRSRADLPACPPASPGWRSSPPSLSFTGRLASTDDPAVLRGQGLRCAGPPTAYPRSACIAWLA